MALNGTGSHNVLPTWQTPNPCIWQHPLTTIQWVPVLDAATVASDNGPSPYKLCVLDPNGTSIDLRQYYRCNGQAFQWDTFAMIRLLHIQDIIWIFRTRPDLSDPESIQNLTLRALVAVYARGRSLRDQVKELYVQINALNLTAKCAEQETIEKIDGYREENKDLTSKFSAANASDECKDALVQFCLQQMPKLDELVERVVGSVRAGREKLSKGLPNTQQQLGIAGYGTASIDDFKANMDAVLREYNSSQEPIGDGVVGNRLSSSSEAEGG